MQSKDHPLFSQIRSSNLKKVRQLAINQNLSSIFDNNHSTLLHISTNSNNYQITQYLLTLYDQHIQASQPNCTPQNKQQWVNQKDKDGFCPLHYAVFRGNFKLSQLLESNGADIYSINRQGLTVLHIAAQGDSPCLMYYYLHKGFKIAVTDFKGSTPLHWACYSGQQNAVNALLAWEAEIDRQDTSYGMTPLHLAVMSGNARIVKKLLLRGCDRNIKNFQNKLALNIAQQNQYRSIEAMILDKGLFQEILNIKTPFRKTEKFTYHFYFLIVTFIVNYILNISFIVSEHITRIFIMCIVFLSLGLLNIILFIILRLINSNLKPEYTQRSYFFQILIRNPSDKICYDCQIVKPIRSRHCQTCKSCISVFDHHCPWIGKCVGSGNYFYFYCFLLSMQLFIGFSIAFEIVNLIVNDWSVFSALLFIRSFCICLSLMMCTIFLAPLTFLLIIQTRNCMKNQTTFEKYSFKLAGSVSSSNLALSNNNLLDPLLANNDENVDKSVSIAGERGSRQYRMIEQVGCVQNCYRMCFGNKNNISYRVGGF